MPHVLLSWSPTHTISAQKSGSPPISRRSKSPPTNELASRLVAQGFAVTPRMIGPVPGFELAGYDGEFLDAFSGRRREILAYLEKHGLPATREATQKATLHTRRRKVEAGLAELVPQWRARARALGLVRDEAALRPPRPVEPETGREMALPVAPEAGLTKNERRRRRRSPAAPHLEPVAETAVRRRRFRPSAPAERIAEPETGVLEAVARAVAHVEERRTVIPAGDIRALVLGHAPGRYRLEEIDAAIERLVAEGELLETVLRGSDRSFVTDRAVKAERRILEAVRQGRTLAVALVPEETVTARLAATRLTAGQANAVRHVLGSGDVVVGVQGRAGSGKTTMLKEVAGLVEGRPLIALAPSAAAARVLEKGAGVPTRTLQWFLVRYGDLSDPDRLERAREDMDGGVLVVDEASMIGTVAMERLLALAGTLGIARVVLVGDTAQLKAVDAGQPFALMQKRGMATAVMDEVLRQEDADLKEAVVRAREGEAGEAMTRLANRVTEHRVEDLGAEAARAWLALGAEDREACAVLAPTHAVRREINAAIREGLAQEGVLTGRTLTIQRLVDRRYTRIEASVLANYEPGDTVVFHRDAYGCRADDVCTITGVGDGWVVLDHADGRERRFRPSGNAARNLGVHETVEIEIRAGDRVRWTRNRKARRRTPALVNGEEARVLSIGPERVRLLADDGTEYSLARSDPHLRHLDHAWSSTVHGAQGKTAKKVIAVLDAGHMANREMFYVEVSRASQGFTLLTDDREALIECLETSPYVPDAALEALGEDLDGPIVDPEAWAAVVAAWEEVEREASGSPPSSVPAYAGVMARLAAFAAVEDLPAEMRAFVDERLGAHEASRAAERQVRELIAGLQDQPRRWPELAWAARSTGHPAGDGPAWRTWRDAGTALVDSARRRLAGEEAPAIPESDRRRLEAALAGVEKVRLKDDAARFARDWRALVERSREKAVPVSLLADHADLSRRGAALARSTGLTAEERRAVEAWQARHATETALVDDFRSARQRAGMLAAWFADHVPLDGAGGVDPEDADVTRWRRDAEAHLRHMRSLLDTDGPHGPYIAAMPEERDGIVTAGREVVERLEALDRATLLWRVCGIAGRARLEDRLPLDLAEWFGTLGEIRRAVDAAAPGDPVGRHLERWLADDGRWRRDRHRVAEVVGLLRDLERSRPRYADLRGDAQNRRAWRDGAEALDGALETVVALADHERRAHLAACGMTAQAFASLVGAVPLWRATDAALAGLDDWSGRAAEVLREGGEGPTIAQEDVERAYALIEEGRKLVEEWAAHPSRTGDMAGARDAVDSVVRQLEAARLTAACQAFAALTWSVSRAHEEGGVHPLDAADYPRLLAALEDLAGREGTPQATRDLMVDWRDADGRWRQERRETEATVARARVLAKTGPAPAAADHPDADHPDAQAWRTEAAAMLTAARAMLADRSLKARHLDALADARHGLAAATATIETTLGALDRAALLQRVKEIEDRAEAAGRLPCDLADWPGLLEEVSAAVADGAPAAGTVRALARRLDDDRRWRRDRARLAKALARLAEVETNRPTFGGSGDDRAAWRAAAPAAAEEAGAAMDAIPEGERTAQLRALGTSPDAFRQRLASVPSWMATDAALDVLADWRRRAGRLVGEAAEPGDPRWRRDATALLAEGRALPGAWKAGGLPARDMAGARDAVDSVVRQLEAARLTAACQAFAALTWSVNRAREEGGVHPLDAADYPRLLAALDDLAEHEGTPQATRDLMVDWRDADGRWRAERRETEATVARARVLAKAGPAPAAADHPDARAWRTEAAALLTAARAMLADRSLKARHLDALADARHGLAAAAATIETTFRALDRAALLQRVKEIEDRAEAAGRLPCDLADWPGLLEEVSAAVADGATADGTVRTLVRRLDDDRRWRRDRGRLAKALARLAEAEANRPTFGGSGDDRVVWRAVAPAAAEEARAAMDAIPEGERTAQLRALGTSPDAFQQRLASVPSWMATDAALDVLADWRRRAGRLGEAAEPGDALWRRDAAALLAEGRALPGAWKAGGLPARDMAGAGDVVKTEAERIDAMLLGDSLRALVRRADAINGEVRDHHRHPLDSPHMAPLREALRQLRDDPRLTAEDRTTVGAWRETLDGWDGERQRVHELVAEALALQPGLQGSAALSDAWRRRARMLLEAVEAGSLNQEAHIRAAGASPRRLAYIVAALPERLAQDDAVREEAGRTRHLLEVRTAMRQLREAPFDVSRSVRWDGTEPLLRGDRLSWVDAEGRHDAVVEMVSHVTGPDVIDRLRIRPVGGTETRSLHAETLRPLADNVTCRRLLWPDETLRQRERDRQYPARNDAFPFACEERVLPGDRIRWTMVRHAGPVQPPLEGDTAQVEAIVEAVEAGVNDVVGDGVTLRVVRSWGMQGAPAAGSTIRQDMRSLFTRGCVRAPWDDETARERRMAETLREIEARRRGRSRGLSM